MKVIIPYRPRPLQRLLHRDLDKNRFSMLVTHRRFGKTVLLVNHLVSRAMRFKGTDGRFYYIGPTYKQVKRMAWDYFLRYTKPIPGIKPNENELKIDFPNGSRVYLVGSDRPDALDGVYSDLTVLDEYKSIKPSVFTQNVRPTLSDRKGSAIVATTPRRNHAYELWKQAISMDWFCRTFKASETGILDSYELESMKKMMSNEEYDQEMECSWEGTSLGAYYAKLLQASRKEGRIRPVGYTGGKVDTYWDLGIRDSTAIWFFQRKGNRKMFIDCYSNSGQPLKHYEEVITKKPYAMGTIYLPHDANKSEFGSGKTTLELLRADGFRDVKVVQRIGVNEGIEAARRLLMDCEFDEVNCSEGLESLEQYHSEWDEKNGVFRPVPCHDWSSHYADAFRYAAVSIKDLKVESLDEEAMLQKRLSRQNNSYESSHAGLGWMGL